MNEQEKKVDEVDEVEEVGYIVESGSKNRATILMSVCTCILIITAAVIYAFNQGNPQIFLPEYVDVPVIGELGQ